MTCYWTGNGNVFCLRIYSKKDISEEKWKQKVFFHRHIYGDDDMSQSFKTVSGK